MKKILIILFCLLSLLSRAQNNTSWFNSYSSATIPTMSSYYVTQATSTAFQAYAQLISDGGADITEFGCLVGQTASLEYGVSASSTGSWTATDPPFMQTTFNFGSPILDGTYYFRPYAINNIGIGYGDYLICIVSSTPTNAPTVSTGTASSITDNSAIVSGSITDNGGIAVTSHGIYYRKIDVGTYTKLSTNGSSTPFSETLTGLTPNSTYYAYAFATNSAGSGFGDVITFNTSGGSGTHPTVTTNSITNITALSAIGGGNVTNQGSSAVTQRGVQWSATSDFASILGSTMDGAGTGSYSSNITGLTCGTTYYVRAYATNSSGTAYGNHVSFTTIMNQLAVTTISAYSDSPSSFSVNCNVINDTPSCGNITFRGITYSSTNPIPPYVTGGIWGSGNGDGDYTVTVTSTPATTITPNTLYYVRSFALINGSIFYFGNVLTVTTLP